MRPGLWLPAGGALLLLVGCASPWGESEGAGPPVTRLEVLRPISIPSGRARALFQDGRQVLSQSYYDPYCELVHAQVSEGTLTVAEDNLQVTRVKERLLKDPIAEIPPFVLGEVNCQEPLYQESRFYLRSEKQSGLLYLRCLVPYFHCQLGPPASPAVVQGILGPSMRVD